MLAWPKQTLVVVLVLPTPNVSAMIQLTFRKP